ncbi:MAG: S41 family peptidase [Lewinella sp.]|nr:S41 family peptidase [Lewinella sp.]
MLATKLLPLFLLFCYSCIQPSAPVETIEGPWQSIGYGRIISFTTDSFQLYDFTNISCLPIREGSISAYQSHSSLSGDTLTLQSGYSKYQYTRIDQIPELCQQSMTKTEREDPVFNFEVLVATIEEHYAYFELNDLDWNSICASARGKVSTATTPTELYQTIEQLFEDLKDNHGGIYPPDEAEVENNDAGQPDELPSYGDFQVADMVTDHHLEESMTKDSWLVKWGKLEDSIGYIQVKAMWLFADLDLSEALIAKNGLVDTYNDALSKLSEADQIAAEAAGIAKIMDRVMADLMGTSTIIIDVRFNGGGQDLAGLKILERFNGKRRVVATKKAVTTAGYTKAYPLYLEASLTPYLKPVYLLTSQQSASATDFMALSAGELPQLRKIGSRTSGAVSDALPKQLPNGWFFSLSNEVYLDNQGKCYENIGVPVDYELNYPTDRQSFFRGVVSDLENDKRQLLEAIDKL